MRRSCDAKKKWKLNSDGGDCGSKKMKLGRGGVWRSVCLAGVESGGPVCVGAFVLASVAVKMLSHLI
jgi:hypothetical protein